MPPRRRSALLARLVVDSPGRPQIILGELRRVILDGAVPPGTVIPLREVAELFGVSHIPVREALKTLIGEALVTHRPHSGYTVAQLTAEELREMYIVRQTLEKASLAAAVRNATDADRTALCEVDSRLEQAIRDDDPIAYQRCSREFHLAMTRPSRMFRLLHLLESAWNVTEPVQSMVHVARADRALLHTDHALMLAAFRARDIDRLLLLADRHHRRLEAVIATLPTDTGLLAPTIDISFAQSPGDDRATHRQSVLPTVGPSPPHLGSDPP
ncbi:GntR family transcriptional regulator [Nocardia sp. NPDC127579]|uniref:GntR family transcriptional regulator n=1 Tax=Nocardia sp. NPDC127579 TaxID=3345402 RepID=UPI00363AF06F